MIRSIARSYPFMNGYGRIANMPVVRSLVDRMTGDSVEAELSMGAYLIAPCSDHVGRATWLFGDLDPKLTRIAQLLLRKGDHVVDIGAHCGLFSLQVADLVGSFGSVDAVEPQPVLCKMLKHSLVQNDVYNVRLHELALGSRAEVATLSIPAANSGAGSLVRRRVGDSRLPVVVHPSGDFLTGLTDGKIRFIKMDVEGYEAEVVRGALAFFNKQRPDIVFFEAQYNRRYEDNATVSLLTECGYTCYPVLPSLRRIRLARPGCKGRLEGVHDILAISNGIVRRDVIATLNAGGVVIC